MGRKLPDLIACQCRAARGLLDWTQGELARRSGLSRSTVRDFEKERHGISYISIGRMISAFEDAGVEFLSDRRGPGVRLNDEFPHGETVAGRFAAR